jgi:hypothetical protein
MRLSMHLPCRPIATCTTPPNDVLPQPPGCGLQRYSPTAHTRKEHGRKANVPSRHRRRRRNRCPRDSAEGAELARGGAQLVSAQRPAFSAGRKQFCRVAGMGPTLRLSTTVTRSHFLTVLTTQAMTSVIHDHVEITLLHMRTRYLLASISQLSGAWGFRRSRRF